MGKRSNFERRRADFYPTPRAAVVPLIPYLRRGGIRTFVEPCCGEGDLVRHLESNLPLHYRHPVGAVVVVSVEIAQFGSEPCGPWPSSRRCRYGVSHSRWSRTIAPSLKKISLPPGRPHWAQVRSMSSPAGPWSGLGGVFDGIRPIFFLLPKIGHPVWHVYSRQRPSTPFNSGLASICRSTLCRSRSSRRRTSPHSSGCRLRFASTWCLPRSLVSKPCAVRHRSSTACACLCSFLALAFSSMVACVSVGAVTTRLPLRLVADTAL